ncbi:hypothetical protein GQ600_16084 [Phytophthora cactorum]|nr:hypothetical protein GQ600_16084 [Phytophthora cactorum]
MRGATVAILPANFKAEDQQRDLGIDGDYDTTPTKPLLPAKTRWSKSALGFLAFVALGVITLTTEMQVLPRWASFDPNAVMSAAGVSSIAYSGDITRGGSLDVNLRKKGYHLFLDGNDWRVCVAPTHPLASHLYDPDRKLTNAANAVPHINLVVASAEQDTSVVTPDLIQAHETCSPKVLDAKDIKYSSSDRFYTMLQTMEALPPPVFHGDHKVLCNENVVEEKLPYCLPISARSDAEFCVGADRIDLLVRQSPTTAAGGSPIIILDQDGSSEALMETTNVTFSVELVNVADLKLALLRKGYHLYDEDNWRVCVAPIHPLAANLYYAEQAVLEQYTGPHLVLVPSKMTDGTSEQPSEIPSLYQCGAGRDRGASPDETDSPSENSSLCANADRMDILLRQSPKKQCFASVLHMLMKDVFEELKAVGLAPILTFGTLLGAVRDVYIFRVCVAPTHPLASQLYDPEHPIAEDYAVPYVDLYSMQQEFGTSCTGSACTGNREREHKASGRSGLISGYSRPSAPRHRRTRFVGTCCPTWWFALCRPRVFRRSTTPITSQDAAIMDNMPHQTGQHDSFGALDEDLLAALDDVLSFSEHNSMADAFATTDCATLGDEIDAMLSIEIQPLLSAEEKAEAAKSPATDKPAKPSALNRSSSGRNQQQTPSNAGKKGKDVGSPAAVSADVIFNGDFCVNVESSHDVLLCWKKIAERQKKEAHHDASGVSIRHETVRLLPFSMEAVHRAMWGILRYSTAKDMMLGPFQTQVVDDNRMNVTMIEKIELGKSEANIVRRFSFRRVFEKNRTVVIWSSYIEMDGSVFVRLREKGYCTSSPFSFGAGVPGSVTRMAVLASPEMTVFTSPEEQKAHIGEMTELVVGTYRVSMGLMHQIIDTLLLREAMGGKSIGGKQHRPSKAQ